MRTRQAGHTETARHGLGTPNRATACPSPRQRTERAHHSGRGCQGCPPPCQDAHGGGGGAMAQSGYSAKPSPSSANTLPTSTQPHPPRTGLYQFAVRDRRGDTTAAPAEGPRGEPRHRRSSGRRRRSSSIPPTLPQACACGSGSGPAAVWMDRAAGHVKSLQSHHPFHVAHVTAPVSATGSDSPFGSPTTQHRDFLRLVGPYHASTWHRIRRSGSRGSKCQSRVLSERSCTTLHVASKYYAGDERTMQTFHGVGCSRSL